MPRSFEIQSQIPSQLGRAVDMITGDVERKRRERRQEDIRFQGEERQDTLRGEERERQDQLTKNRQTLEYLTGISKDKSLTPEVREDALKRKMDFVGTEGLPPEIQKYPFPKGYGRDGEMVTKEQLESFFKAESEQLGISIDQARLKYLGAQTEASRALGRARDRSTTGQSGGDALNAYLKGFKAFGGKRDVIQDIEGQPTITGEEYEYPERREFFKQRVGDILGYERPEPTFREGSNIPQPLMETPAGQRAAQRLNELGYPVTEQNLQTIINNNPGVFDAARR